MDPVSDAIYSDPSAWRIDTDASEGTLAMVMQDGPRPLFRLPRFHGSFYLRPTGRLAGFALHLDLPEEARPARLRGQEPPTLYWESTDLRTGTANDLDGRGMLQLGRRETWTAVSGVCSPVPYARSGLPYLKIVLETTFPSLALWWPQEARRRLRPVLLTLFAEIRPARVGPGSPPQVPGPRR
ncbi:hypothetical protein ACFY4C_18505 [Actinomadura viridis]|uniref:hypothetical protein n=1 Tax=Actinomadura viridis TaxID=58110 RepID=UPI0036A81380